MRKKIWIGILFTLLLCSGCTRKEEGLVLTPLGESKESSQVTGAETEDASQETETGDGTLEAADAAINGTGSQETGATSLMEEVDTTLYLYICGEVREPGVYELPVGSRVFDAVDAAGGFTEEADETYVNLVASVSDGMQIRIPGKEETAVAKEETTNSSSIVVVSESLVAGEAASSGNGDGIVNDGDQGGNNGLININTADVSGLCEIPGIGESRANDIISYRQEHGGFETIEDIMKVTGIKDKMFAKIKDKITV